MAALPDTAAIVANIMAEAASDTIHRLQTILEANTDGTTRCSRCTDSPVSTVSTVAHEGKEADSRPLQAWFMANLAHPYPPLSVKRRFASELGISLRNIDTQFTNWRRRSGWSAIKRRWADGSDKAMANLMARYTSGDETRTEVRAAIQRMAEYLEEDTAGQWIANVSFPLVTPPVISHLHLKILPHTNDDSISSGPSRSSSLSLSSQLLSNTPPQSPTSPTKALDVVLPSPSENNVLSSSDDQSTEPDRQASSKPPLRKRRRCSEESLEDMLVLATPTRSRKRRISSYALSRSRSRLLCRLPTSDSPDDQAVNSAPCEHVEFQGQLAVELQRLSHSQLALGEPSADQPALLDWTALDTAGCHAGSRTPDCF